MTTDVDAVEVVRAFTAALGAGDVRACLGLLAEDIVFSEAASLPFGGEWVGKNGFVSLLKTVGRDFDVRLDTPQVDAAGDDVLVRVRGTFTSRRTGRSMPAKVLDLYRVDDGLVARVDVYYQDSRALWDLCEPSDAGHSQAAGASAAADAEAGAGAGAR